MEMHNISQFHFIPDCSAGKIPILGCFPSPPLDYFQYLESNENAQVHMGTCTPKKNSVQSRIHNIEYSCLFVSNLVYYLQF